MIGLWVRRPTVRNANGGLMTCMRSWRYFARFKKPPRKTAIVDNLKTRYPADRMTLPFSRSMYCKFDFFFLNQASRARAYTSACTSSLHMDCKPASELICATLDKDVIKKCRLHYLLPENFASERKLTFSIYFKVGSVIQRSAKASSIG